MNKVYYSMDIQMRGTYEVEEAVLESASRIFGFSKKDIEESETHSVSILFVSGVSPTEMRERVSQFLVSNKAVYYVDVMYRFEYAMVPDRFVRWQDGSTSEYTGYISFREDM